MFVTIHRQWNLWIWKFKYFAKTRPSGVHVMEDLSPSPLKYLSGL